MSPEKLDRIRGLDTGTNYEPGIYRVPMLAGFRCMGIQWERPDGLEIVVKGTSANWDDDRIYDFLQGYIDSLAQT